MREFRLKHYRTLQTQYTKPKLMRHIISVKAKEERA